MINHDDGVDYDAALMLIMDQMMMTATPDVFILTYIHPWTCLDGKRIHDNP